MFTHKAKAANVCLLQLPTLIVYVLSMTADSCKALETPRHSNKQQDIVIDRVQYELAGYIHVHSAVLAISCFEVSNYYNDQRFSSVW